MPKKRGANAKKRAESGIELPERLALTPLIDTTGLLGGATGGYTTIPSSDGSLPSAPAPANENLTGAMNNIGEAAQTAQQSGSGATAENIESDGSTSTSTTNSSP